MKVSKRFLRDFAYIANLYGWNAEDIEDVKAQTRANPGEMCRYWTELAVAHRAGYAQTRENNFVRLGQWLQLQNHAGIDQAGFRDQYVHTRKGARSSGPVSADIMQVREEEN